MIGVSVIMMTSAIGTLLLVRWGMSKSDDATAAIKSQLEQTANMHEAERQRDVEHVARVKAEGDLAVTVEDNAKLHDTITTLLKQREAEVRKKIDNATGDDLVAVSLAAFGVPPRPVVPAASRAGGAVAGGGAAPAPAVPVPGAAKPA